MLLDVQAEREPPALDCFVLAMNDGARQHLYPISDRGPGIPLAEQPQVFEALRQGAAALRKGPGALGLYFTRWLIESLGGSIDLESRTGSGSTFRLWLPSRSEAPCEPQPEGGAA